MKMMYKAVNGYNARIEPVQVSSETEKTITIAGRRYGKISNYEAYFDTPGQAYKFLSDHSEQKIIDANRAMKAAQEYAEQVAKLAPNAR